MAIFSISSGPAIGSHPKRLRPMKTPKAADWMNFVQAMEYLGKSRSFVLSAISKAFLPAHRLGKRWYFRQSEIDTWLDNLPGMNLPGTGVDA